MNQEQKNCQECGIITRPKKKGNGYTKYCDNCATKLAEEGRFENKPKRKTVKILEEDFKDLEERVTTLENKLALIH